MIEWAWIVPQVRRLFMNCPLRSQWSENEFNRLVLPPLALGQWCVYVDGGELKGWASWAFLSDEASEIFSTKKHPIRPEDWKTGTNAWVVDFVTTPGYAAKFGLHMKRTMRTPGTLWRYTRIGKNRVGYVRISENG